MRRLGYRRGSDPPNDTEEPDMAKGQDKKKETKKPKADKTKKKP